MAVRVEARAENAAALAVLLAVLAVLLAVLLAGLIVGLFVDKGGFEGRRSPGASSARRGWPGRNRVVVGVMPALRVRSRTSATWSSVISVTTVPVGAGPGGAAGAVQVGLVLDRRVGVDDERDVVDVDAACGDVGGDQRGRAALGEGVQVAGAGVLARLPCSSTAGTPAALS